MVRQGLYPREAAAMVNTWKDQWFADEGTRVLFLLPRESTDRALPLTMTPAPAHVVRVMVGRSEVILPSVERELHKQIVRYSSGDHSDRSSALAGVRGLGLGRFLGPAIERVLQLNPDQKLAEAAWRLAEAVGEETSRKLV